MLIQCPECQKQISDKAISCPQCGYPLDVAKCRKQRQTSAKRRRLPNGFGQISKLSNPRLHKPYRAMVTVGKTPEGKPICKLLQPVAYFESYNEAYTALLRRQSNPDLTQDKTFAEVYQEWSDKYDRKPSSTRMIKSVYSRCAPLYTLKMSQIRTIHIRDCILNAQNTSACMQASMKTYLGSFFGYAIECGYVDRNYAKEVKLPKQIQEEASNQKRHISFTDEEMATLWDNKGKCIMLLIQCYSGWRPVELATLQIDSVNIIDWTFTGGVKTANGINRVVPIHSKIKDLVKTAYDDAIASGRNTLFSASNYNSYKWVFDSTIRSLHLDPNHKPHDCRKQFVTMAKRAGVDEYAIKRIIGHSIADLTESVYTDRSIEWLRSEIEKI